MRIVGIRVEPFARVLGITYTVFGLSAYAVFAIKGSDYLTLPFGVLAPLVSLDFTLTLARSSGVFYNIFLCIASVLSYAVSGWITGVVGALCFNAVAKQTGGIDAKYLCTVDKAGAAG
ncbi:MAG TPA: hypothetical protein VHR84_14470 [Terriglobales bacterium]|jgi:hypothetical protein|nr:hypothetical protein [Terriglobales bacterium]